MNSLKIANFRLCCDHFKIQFKMKLFVLFVTLATANFLHREESSQFLTQRSKCGDDCTKTKTKVRKKFNYSNILEYFYYFQNFLNVKISTDLFRYRKIQNNLPLYLSVTETAKLICPTVWTGAIVFVSLINLAAYANTVASKIDVPNTKKETTNMKKIVVIEKSLFVR